VGSATARLLVAKGWHVLAADVDDRALASLAGIERLTLVHLDATDQASISAAFDQVRDMATGLDRLVNTAGVIALGSMIEMDEPSLSHVRSSLRGSVSSSIGCPPASPTPSSSECCPASTPTGSSRPRGTAPDGDALPHGCRAST